MLTFEPDSPWAVGQIVIFREGERQYRKIVVEVEHSEEGWESQYVFENADTDRYLYRYIDTEV